MSTRTSKSYIGTYSYEDAGGMLEIEKIRDTVKVINRANGDKKYRVVLKGRFGENNPNLDKYTHWTQFGEKYVDWMNCRLEDAQRVDVYVYARS